MHLRTLTSLVLVALLTAPATGQNRAKEVEDVALPCDPSALVQSVRELVGPEKPRTFPTPAVRSVPQGEPGFRATCRLPNIVCAAQQEAEAAAARAELMLRLRNQVLALERCGY